jgi:hypothetical protein
LASGHAVRIFYFDFEENEKVRYWKTNIIVIQCSIQKYTGMGREYQVDIHVYVNIIQDNKIHEQLD